MGNNEGGEGGTGGADAGRDVGGENKCPVISRPPLQTAKLKTGEKKEI